MLNFIKIKGSKASFVILHIKEKYQLIIFVTKINIIYHFQKNLDITISY